MHSFTCNFLLGPICREHILLPRGTFWKTRDFTFENEPFVVCYDVLGGVTSFPPSFLVNQLLDLMVSQRRDVIPKCESHTNEELLFCETCDKIFCHLCDQHQISAEHTVVPFSLAIKRMNEILSFKASKSKQTLIYFSRTRSQKALDLIANMCNSEREILSARVSFFFLPVKSYLTNTFLK